MNYIQWEYSLRKVNCMDQEDFKECFGPDGNYLWDKFVNHKNGDPCDFICYLDQFNVKKLYEFVMKKMLEEEQRRKKA